MTHVRAASANASQPVAPRGARVSRERADSRRAGGAAVRRRATVMIRCIARTLIVCGMLAPAVAPAQWPPQKIENVKVLPANIALRPLVDTMAGFTRALGVRCTFCHVGTEGADLGTYDFISDSLATKRTAREMMRMVLAINQDYVSKIVGPS